MSNVALLPELDGSTVLTFHKHSDILAATAKLNGVHENTTYLFL